VWGFLGVWFGLWGGGVYGCSSCVFYVLVFGMFCFLGFCGVLGWFSWFAGLFLYGWVLRWCCPPYFSNVVV
jgi:hypothetical protein